MICQLPAETASQIAAGEVVERPASIVKELVENALDAGSHYVNIQLEQGGLKRIVVKDDGCGIAKDQLPLTTLAHATSKIRTLDDLDCITTFGFRGEALASIESVSRFSIQSRNEQAEHGWEWSEQLIKPTAMDKGTTVSVVDLFYNVPARRKFMRAQSTEFKHCLSVIHRMALAHPEVAFSVDHNGKSVFKCGVSQDSASLLKRIGQICGDEFSNALIEIDVKQESLHLTGFLAQSTFSRAQSDMLFWYVNRRSVKDGLLNAAARRAYQDQMYQSRHPAFILNLTLPANQVDVNVHPAKSEVRFRSHQVFQFIQQVINHVITRPIAQQTVTYRGDDRPKISRSIGGNHSELTTPHAQGQTVDSVSHSPNRSPSFAEYAGFIQDIKPRVIQEADNGVYPKAFDRVLGEAIAFIHGVYILSQTQLGLCIVDAHGAHERVLYEQLKQAHDTNRLSAQKLLVPVSLSLSVNEVQLLNQHHSHFEALQFDIDVVSDRSAIVRQIPSLLLDVDIAQLIKDTLADWQQEHGSVRVMRQIHDLLSSVACHGAVRANRAMNVHEMNALLRQLEKVESGSVCNHGRPIVQHFSLSAMDKWFKRGQ